MPQRIENRLRQVGFKGLNVECLRLDSDPNLSRFKFALYVNVKTLKVDVYNQFHIKVTSKVCSSFEDVSDFFYPFLQYHFKNKDHATGGD